MVVWMTRKYPPSVGGMEKFNYELTRELSSRLPLHLLASGRSPRSLPSFVANAASQVLAMRGRGIQVRGVHLGDGVLAPVGLALGRLLGDVPVTVTVHGLDVIYPSPVYQQIIPRCLARSARVTPNSTATYQECIRRGVAQGRCQVIPCGVAKRQPLVETNLKSRHVAREMVARALGRDLSEGPTVLCVGRLVRRKGVAWFVERVVPRLVEQIPEVSVIVVGSGPDRERIARVRREVGLERSVVTLGRVADDVLDAVYAASDVFAMPNIPTTGDMEGFGIAALEASVAGLWVLAANLDGIPDAIHNGLNGALLPPLDAAAWASRLADMLGDPLACRRAGTLGREFTLEHFRWSTTADRYEGMFSDLGMVG